MGTVLVISGSDLGGIWVQMCTTNGLFPIDPMQYMGIWVYVDNRYYYTC